MFGLRSCTYNQSFGIAPACLLPSKTKLTTIKITTGAFAYDIIKARIDPTTPDNSYTTAKQVIQDLTDILDERFKDKITNAERKLHNGNLQIQEDEMVPRYYTRFVATMVPLYLTFNDQIRLLKKLLNEHMADSIASRWTFRNTQEATDYLRRLDREQRQLEEQNKQSPKLELKAQSSISRPNRSLNSHIYDH